MPLQFSDVGGRGKILRNDATRTKHVSNGFVVGNMLVRYRFLALKISLLEIVVRHFGGKVLRRNCQGRKEVGKPLSTIFVTSRK